MKVRALHLSEIPESLLLLLRMWLSWTSDVVSTPPPMATVCVRECAKPKTWSADEHFTVAKLQERKSKKIKRKKRRGRRKRRSSVPIPESEALCWREGRGWLDRARARQTSRKCHQTQQLVGLCLPTSPLREKRKMSFKIAQTLPPNPVTSRGTFTQLSTDPKGEKVVYCQSRTVVIRPLDSSASTVVYSQHAHPTTVARISPSGFYCASADVAGNVRVWDLAGDEQVLKLEIKALGGRITDLSWDGESKRIGVVGEGKDR